MIRMRLADVKFDQHDWINWMQCLFDCPLVVCASLYASTGSLLSEPEWHVLHDIVQASTEHMTI